MYIENREMAISNLVEREPYHIPVMVGEVLRFLSPVSGGIYLDCTLGTGGHAEAILKASEPDGVVIGIDMDEEALTLAKMRLSRFGARFKLIYGNFKDAEWLMKGMNIEGLNGVLLDLGISSLQIEDSKRGFSFMRDGPLDMRMDRKISVTAEEIINTWQIEKIERILKEYGEEPFARRIAKRIGEYRQKNRISTTSELREIIHSAVPSRVRFRHRIDPATKSFQALRIAVNSELENLRTFLDSALDLILRGGRMVIISYHSLEDRIVKNKFREWKSSGLFKILTPEVVVPSEKEKMNNPRSRSAKLRAGEKIK